MCLVLTAIADATPVAEAVARAVFRAGVFAGAVTECRAVSVVVASRIGLADRAHFLVCAVAIARTVPVAETTW